MFVTPIIYPSSLMPQKYRLLYSLNPMAGIIEAFRVSLLVVLIYAAYDFRRMEKHFADLI